MDVQEASKHLETGIMVCKPTLVKLGKAAVLMEDFLLRLRKDGPPEIAVHAAAVLQEVADL